jgi:hypothetical protein
MLNATPKAPHPLADAPDVIITTKVTSMCYACREPIPEAVEALWRRTNGVRHYECKHPEPTNG